MYTAKILNKDNVGGAIRVFVEFTDGTKTITDSCIPQNEEGFRFWVKSRLETFNAAPEIETKYADGTTVDVGDTVVTPPTPTVAEIARDEWLQNYYKWLKVKTTLIDTGVLTGNETKVLALQNKVKTNFLPAYIDLI